MPEQFSEDEIAIVVDKGIAGSGANSTQDTGKLMGLLKGQLAGKADMGTVSSIFKRP